MDLKRSMLYPVPIDVNSPEEQQRIATASSSIGLPVEVLPPSYAAATTSIPTIQTTPFINNQGINPHRGDMGCTLSEYMPTPEDSVNTLSGSIRHTVKGDHIFR